MQTDIQSHGFNLTKSIREYTERKLGLALNFASQHIRRVTVRLTDINGPQRGGEDKSCQLIFTLSRMPSVVVEHVGQDLYAAIDLATERASQSVARQIERKQTQLARKHRHRANLMFNLGSL